MNGFHRCTSLVVSVFLVSSLLAGLTFSQEDEDVLELEAFIVEESMLENSGSLLPTDSGVSGVFFNDMNVLDIPRSVTVITPGAMTQFQIKDLDDLSRVGSGTQTINFYGVPGVPVLRGVEAGVTFNGILRAHNRNEMPISFGSLESINLVKGPAPANMTPAQIGGIVDFIPKSPYFDRFRGSIKLEVGSYDHYNAQVDVGGPFLAWGKPTAYRISLTAQEAESYYDNVGNDFVSLYGSFKSKLSQNVRIYGGFEFFDFSSNENAGWNRPTQNLIDNGAYVIGEPINIVDAGYGGNANRALIGANTALIVPRSIVDAALSQGKITQAMVDAMNDSSEIAAAYTGELAPLAGNPNIDGYQYTQDYFDAGGIVFTQKIDGSTVLSDPSDYADSTDFLGFFDVSIDTDSGIRHTWKNYIEHLQTEKRSSYGYAIETEQIVLESRWTVDWRISDSWRSEFGASLRYTDAMMLQDYFAEPFSRRDISQSSIDPNTVVPAGPQRGPDGKNFWSPDGGANVTSELLQSATFAVLDWTPHEMFSTYFSGRAEYADFDVALPGEVDQAGPSLPGTLAAGSGEKSHIGWSVSPVFSPFRQVRIYGAYQETTALDPTQGGPIFGEDNFAKARLTEGGIKVGLMDGRVYFTAAYFEWEQNRYNDRDRRSEPLEGEGVELELTWQINERLTLIASFDQIEVRRNAPLGFRTIPMDEQAWALYGGELNSIYGGYSFATGGPGSFSAPANNPEMEYPGFPERTFKLFAIYDIGAGFGVSGGPVWQDAFWLNFDRTIQLPEALIWNFNTYYRSKRFEMMLSVENAFDEEYFSGAEPLFGANAVVTQAPTAACRLSLTYLF